MFCLICYVKIVFHRRLQAPAQHVAEDFRPGDVVVVPYQGGYANGRIKTINKRTNKITVELLDHDAILAVHANVCLKGDIYDDLSDV